MNDNDFQRQQQAAVEKMKEMNRQARSYSFTPNNTHSIPNGYSQMGRKVSTPSPQRPQSTDKKNPSTNTANEPKQKNPLPDSGIPLLSGGGLNIPLLDSITKDGDIALILGLLLILLSENCDKKLLFALIYILL